MKYRVPPTPARPPLDVSRDLDALHRLPPGTRYKRDLTEAECAALGLRPDCWLEGRSIDGVVKWTYSFPGLPFPELLATVELPIDG